MDKPNYYAILPATVRYSSDIRPMAKLLFAEITALSNKDGYCTAGNKYFAECYDLSTRTVNRCLEELNKANFIDVKITKNATGTWRKIYPLVDATSRVTKKELTPTSYGYDENVKRGVSKTSTQKNTTRNNNTTTTKERTKEFFSLFEIKEFIRDEYSKDWSKLSKMIENQTFLIIPIEVCKDGLASFMTKRVDSLYTKIDSIGQLNKELAEWIRKEYKFSKLATTKKKEKQTKPTCDYSHTKLETKALVHQFDYNKYFELANQEIGTRTGALKNMYPDAYNNDLPLYESKLKELTELKKKEFSHHHNINELNLFELIYAQMPNPYQSKFRAYRRTPEDSKEETLRRFKLFINELGDYKGKFGNLRLLSKNAR